MSLPCEIWKIILEIKKDNFEKEYVNVKLCCDKFSIELFCQCESKLIRGVCNYRNR